MKAISLRNIYFRYSEDSPILLKDLNYDFEYGKFYLIFGESGGGKSTILSLLNGRIPHYQEGQFKGEIVYNGEDIYEKDIGERSGFISSLFQNPDEQVLYDKVEDELAFPLENIGTPRKEMEEKISHSCKILGLDKEARTGTLSGGEKQRLEACSALSLPNKIILLDEPLANLDKESSELLLQELRRRADEGYCVILVEHRLDRLKPYIDVAIQNKDGKLVEAEDPFHEEMLSPSETNSVDETILEVKNMGVLIKKKRILSGISFNLHKGEKLLVIGDNGVGKTTLLRALSGLIKHQEGSISSPYLKKRKDWFKNIGYLFQNPDYQLFLKTVEEEVFVSDVDEEYARHLIEVFNLKPFLSSHPLSLSEGQKRKLTFVSTLARKPKILFLDEPTVGQDYLSLSKFVDEVNYLVKENGTSVITVTHDRRCMQSLMDISLLIEKEKEPRLGKAELLEEYISREYVD